MSPAEGDNATRLMLECLGAFGELRAPLIVDEPTGRLAEPVRDAGGAPIVWLRHCYAGARVAASAWPPECACDGAMIRLPKAKEAALLALHAAAARLPPAAPIAVFGGNAEGIRSVARLMGDLAEDVATLATGHHARVITGRCRDRSAGLKAHLADWRHVRTIGIAGLSRDWVSYPGTFAKGGLDAGTAFLLQHLPDLPSGARVLDFAAGTGVVAAAIAACSRQAQIDLIDADALAVEAARENVPDARAIVGSDLVAAGGGPYDLIASNPPVHDGVAESRAVLDRLIVEAPRHLRSGGRLLLVVQRRIPVLPALEAAFGAATVLGDDGRFTVAMATRRQDGRRR